MDAVWSQRSVCDSVASVRQGVGHERSREEKYTYLEAEHFERMRYKFVPGRFFSHVGEPWKDRDEHCFVVSATCALTLRSCFEGPLSLRVVAKKTQPFLSKCEVRRKFFWLLHSEHFQNLRTEENLFLCATPLRRHTVVGELFLFVLVYSLVPGQIKQVAAHPCLLTAIVQAARDGFGWCLRSSSFFVSLFSVDNHSVLSQIEHNNDFSLFLRMHSLKKCQLKNIQPISFRGGVFWSSLPSAKPGG